MADFINAVNDGIIQSLGKETKIERKHITTWATCTANRRLQGASNAGTVKTESIIDAAGAGEPTNTVEASIKEAITSTTLKNNVDAKLLATPSIAELTGNKAAVLNANLVATQVDVKDVTTPKPTCKDDVCVEKETSHAAGKLPLSLVLFLAMAKWIIA